MATDGDWVEAPAASVVTVTDAAALFRSEICRQLFRGYLGLFEAAGHTVPDKDSLDLFGLRTTLADAALCAITLPDRCIYRVAGERLKRRLGLNPTGRNYYDFVPAVRRERAARAMNMVIQVPCAFRAEIEQTYTSGETVLIEVVAVPLRSQEPGVDGFILFADCALSQWKEHQRPAARLQGAVVVRRDLIDLGFGVDPEFRDLVPRSRRSPSR